MNRINFERKNKAALFFAMALLPTTFVFAQNTEDSVKEKQIEEVIVIGYGKQKKKLLQDL